MDNSKISGARLMFTIACFLQASALLTSFLAGVSEKESWLVIMSGFAVSLPILWVYAYIMKHFPNQNLFQVLRLVFGKVLGTILAVGYMWFFLTITSLNLSDYIDFAKMTVMYNTPKMVLLIMASLTAVYAVRKGLSVFTRYSAVLVIFDAIVIVISIIFAAQQMDFGNILPMFTMPPIKYLQGSHIISTIPIGEVIVFLMLTPNIKVEPKKIFKYISLGVLIGIGCLMLSTLRDVLVLGETLHLFALPGLITYRLINIARVFSRMEILFAIALMILLLFKVILLLYVCCKAAATLFGSKNYRNLALPIGAFVTFFGITLYPNAIVHGQSAQSVVPFVWSTFEMLIPIIVIVVAKIRKLPKQSSANQINKINGQGAGQMAYERPSLEVKK